MFGLGEKSYLGIDIGTSAIKVIEAKIRKNKPYISNYAIAKFDNMKKSGNEISMDDHIAEYLKEIIRRGKFSSGEVYAAMPSSGGLVVLIEVPNMLEQELNQAIQFEAHKYIPLPAEEVSLSWDVIDEPKTGDMPNQQNSNVSGLGQGKIKVLLVAVPKSNVVKYQNLIQKTGLKLKALEIESFSLVRSLIGKDPGKFIIIDIGSRLCNIILVEGGEIRVNRNLDAGGMNITQEISRSMNISEDRAEKMKISGGNLLGPESNLNFPVFNTIVDETKRVLESYYKTMENAKIDGIILSGGTAKIAGLDKYFSGFFGVKAMTGNPLSRIEYDPRLEAHLNEIKFEFSVGIGLALKGVEEANEKNNNKNNNKNNFSFWKMKI